MVEQIANIVVRSATLGKIGVQINPEFKRRMDEVRQKETKLSQRLYNSGTIAIISDNLYWKFQLKRDK